MLCGGYGPGGEPQHDQRARTSVNLSAEAKIEKRISASPQVALDMVPSYQDPFIMGSYEESYESIEESREWFGKIVDSTI